jgi:hypothetical protein
MAGWKWQTVHYLMTFVPLNHESSTLYFIFQSVSQTNMVSMNVMPLAA